MEAGSEVIICYAKVIFKNGLLMSETKILPSPKLVCKYYTKWGLPVV